MREAISMQSLHPTNRSLAPDEGGNQHAITLSPDEGGNQHAISLSEVSHLLPESTHACTLDVAREGAQSHRARPGAEQQGEGVRKSRT
jgi:hypothetical protein